MSQKYHEFHYDLSGTVMAQCREWVTANDCPHGHVCGVFGSSHPYLRCNQPLNSHLLREKVYFWVARLANSMLLSVTLDILSVFFLMSNFSLI